VSRVEKLKTHLQDKNVGKLKAGGRNLAEFKALYSDLHWLLAAGGSPEPDPPA
jgi:hypothetical protein